MRVFHDVFHARAFRARLGKLFGCRRLFADWQLRLLVRAMRRFVRVAAAGAAVVIVILAARVAVRYTFCCFFFDNANV